AGRAIMNSAKRSYAITATTSPCSAGSTRPSAGSWGCSRAKGATMCNPRRVRITATRELAEAWQREVTRSVQLRGRVVGEARARQALGDALSTPVRVAFEA